MNSDVFLEVELLVLTYNAHKDITAKFPLLEQFQYVLVCFSLQFLLIFLADPNSQVCGVDFRCPSPYVCVDTARGPVCRCPEGFAGPNCQFVNIDCDFVIFSREDAGLWKEAMTSDAGQCKMVPLFA